MEWIRGQRIGQGRFGTVDLAIPISQMVQNSPVMAVKSCSSTRLASLLNEKVILDELRDCPEIIRSFGDCFTLENGEKLYNVLLEYASGGDLGEKMKNSVAGELPELEVRRCTKSILRGLHSIHKNGYVHCDIKPQNVLIGRNDSVKIADFGLAKKAGKTNLGCELRGTPMYMSPEMVTGGEQESPADIWALGCMVAEMITGAPAWRCRRELNFGELFMRIAVGEEVPEIPEKLSDHGKHFLEKCFLKDPRQRWTAEMLLNHPFVANYDDDSECREVASTSPKSAFDFPDWVSEQTSETTLLSTTEYSLKTVEFDWSSSSFPRGSLSISPAVRLHQLVTDHQRPNWSDLGNWVTVRSS